MWRSTDDGCTSASSSGSMTMRLSASASRIERSERITEADSTDGARTPPARRASMPPVLRRLVPFVLLVGAGVLATAGVASAHTGWKPDAVAPGSIASLTLSVAAENDSAGTVKVELYFPEGVDLTTVEAPAPAGWT